MPQPAEHRGPDESLAPEEAEELAESMRAFGAASRLRLLYAMLEGERTVDELLDETDLAPSAASHQLRLLRHERLVRVRRDGRNAYYRLFDDHVADLLAAIRHHHEHAVAPAPAATRRSQ